MRRHIAYNRALLIEVVIKDRNALIKTGVRLKVVVFLVKISDFQSGDQAYIKRLKKTPVFDFFRRCVEKFRHRENEAFIETSQFFKALFCEHAAIVHIFVRART